MAFDPTIMRQRFETLTEAERNALPPSLLGMLSPPKPRGILRALVENSQFLSSRKALRRLFDLDAPKGTINQPFPVDDPVMGRGYSWYQEQMRMARDRQGMYMIYEEMDDYSSIATILDMYAEDATQLDPSTGRVIWAESDNGAVKKAITEMFDRIGVDDLAPIIARAAAKLGDDFEQVITSTTNGIEAVKHVYPTKLSRVEDKFGKLQGFAPILLSDDELRQLALTDDFEKLNLSKPWDFVHFRMPQPDRNSVHGGSLIAPARSVWRQLKIMEDCVVLYRVNRAPDRIVHYVGVGADMGFEDKMRVAQDYGNALRRRIALDQQQGTLKQEYAAMTVDEDLIVVVGGESDKSRIEKLPQTSNMSDVEDVKFYLRKLFAALRVPPAYMAMEDDLNAKATLSTQDIRYARGAKKIQRMLIYGFTQLARIHLSLRGIDPTLKENHFTLRMTPISYLDELQRAELVKMRMDVASAMVDLGVKMDLNRVSWFLYVLTEHLMMTEQEAQRFMLAAAGKNIRAMPPVPAGSEPAPTKPGDSPVDAAAGANEPPAEGTTSTKVLGPGESLTEEQRRDVDAAVAKAVPAERRALVREATEILRHDSVVVREGKLPQKLEEEAVLFDLDAELSESLKAVWERDQKRRVPVISTCPACAAPSSKLRIFEGATGQDEKFACTSCGLLLPIGDAPLGSPAPRRRDHAPVGASR